jgi:opacity protein-like surface antigen
MEKVLLIILMSLVAVASASAATAPAVVPATPVTGVAAPDTSHWLYAGAQLGDSIVGGLLGLQFTKSYSLEVRYDYIDPVIQPNNKVTASSTGAALVAMFPVKFSGIDPFFLFAKAGYERKETKSTTSDPGIPGLFPASTSVSSTVTNRATVGAGAQYDFTNNVSGRIGMNAIGSDHSVYLSAIYKF